MSRPLSRVRPINHFFHKSHVGAEVLKEKQKLLHFPDHKLIMDCKTRWNTTYMMVERYQEQRVPIMAALADQRVAGGEARGMSADLSDSEASTLNEYMAAMKLMYTVTLAMSTESCPNAGLILPLHQKLFAKGN